jgi:hypothetical protein
LSKAHLALLRGFAEFHFGIPRADWLRSMMKVYTRPWKARLAELGGARLTGSPADFGRLMIEEVDKWATVIKFAGIKVE